MTKIEKNQKFSFKCHSEIACFNSCCQDLNQILTPYDILRLKHHFKINSQQFLETYTNQSIGPETGLPVILLKTKSRTDLRCIFVEKKGCQVYPDRPASCRYYPLARVTSRSRINGKISASYMLLKEHHCVGHDYQTNSKIQKQTIDLWIKSQEIADYDKYNNIMLELIAAKNQNKIKDLSENDRYLFFICCYDIDNFRKYAYENKLLSQKQQSVQSIEDDIDLLNFSIKWLKEKYFKS